MSFRLRSEAKDAESAGSGLPPKPSKAGSAGRGGARKRGKEYPRRECSARSVLCSDEGKHRVRLYAGHISGALPRAPSSTQAPYHLPSRQRQGAFTPLRLLSKRNPLRWAFVWFGRKFEGDTNAERTQNGTHHPAGDTPGQGGHPDACEGCRPDRHRLPVLQRAGQGDRAGGRPGQGAVRAEGPGAQPESAHHAGPHGEDHRRVRQQAGGGLRAHQ